MTNARKIKEAIKQDLDSMTTEQLFAFCNLFEDARQYGISLNDTTFYTCDRCRREHNGCLREGSEDANGLTYGLKQNMGLN